jgi:hypothetical protein
MYTLARLPPSRSHNNITQNLNFEEHRLGVLDNRVLRRIFGSKRDEVTGDWRKLHNKE